MDGSAAAWRAERRAAFTWWLRTGLLRPPRAPDGRELKFNPYHDPDDGRFTFASGAGASGAGGGGGADDADAAAAAEGSPSVRGSNSAAFLEPMTLDQAFPGLADAPGGAVLSAADNLFDITGPASAMQAEVLQRTSANLQAQIKAIDPTWHYDKLGPITSVEGLSNEVNYLRFEQAAAIARVKGDYGPLQVETVRYIQQQANTAYDEGLALQKAGRLTTRLSDQEALGNYVDKQVRENLRERLNQAEIDWTGSGPVRVNSREYDSSGDDRSYRIPDSRVGDVAYDVTLSRKTLQTAQVRGYFDADFRPSRVVIVRPSRLGEDHTYAIVRPEVKR